MFKENKRFWLASLTFVVSFSIICATLTHTGFCWDELIYMPFAQNYILWFSSDDMFSQEKITEYWGKGWVHPPFAKVSMGITGFLFFLAKPHRTYIDFLTGGRLFPALIFSLMVSVMAAFTAKRFGAASGILSAAALFLSPRIFGHAHFATIDMAMAAMWFFTVICFIKGAGDFRWSIICGAVFGLAVLTKINSAVLPFVLWPWGLFFYRKKALWNILFMTILGAGMFFALWPWMWVDAWSHFTQYLADKLGRTGAKSIIEVYYLGKTYGRPPAPWHYPIVMTFVTVPVGFLLGFFAFFRRFAGKIRRKKIEILLLLNFLAVIAVASLPNVPRYDGVRLFMPGFAFLAMMAGIGLGGIWEYLKKRRSWKRVACAAFVILVMLQGSGVVLSFPFNLSYYNALAGGAAGAKKLGFESTYWGEPCNRRIFDYLNENVPPNGGVLFLHFGSGQKQLYSKYYLREDINPVDDEKSGPDFIVLNVRQGKFSDFDWQLYRNRTPAFGNYLCFGRVPLCLVYRMDRARE